MSRGVHRINTARTAGHKVDYLEEDKGKDLYRHAFAYAEKIEGYCRRMHNLSDVFQPELVSLRGKLQKKCQDMLFLSCSKRRKAEELLWKHVVYGVISQCKQCKEILNPTHPYHGLYNTHLINAAVFYQQLLQDLQDHYHIQITKMTSAQLEEMDSANVDSQWLKEAIQRCFIYLGDIARYQVDLGYSPGHAVSFYEQAITLDPGNGCPYNQLAALSEAQDQWFDAVFYYMRSLTAPKPFPGVERNIDRLVKKNCTLLTKLESSQETVMELQLPQFKKDLLLSHSIHLQCLLLSYSRGTKEDVKSKATDTVSEVCSKISLLFQDCLEYDLNTYTEHCPSAAAELLGKQTSSSDIPLLLDISILFKLSSLSFLPAYNLRLKGSSDTLLACAFAFSVLSHLLLYSYKKLLYITVEVVNQKRPLPSLQYEELLKTNGLNIIQLLEEGQGMRGSDGKEEEKKTISQATGLEDTMPHKKERRSRRKRRRRRRRRERGDDYSSSEEDQALTDSTSDSSQSPSEELMNIEEKKNKRTTIDIIDSISETDSSDSDHERKPHPQLGHSREVPITPPKARPRPQFNIAATFSLVPDRPMTTQPVTSGSSSHLTTDERLSEDIKQLKLSTDREMTMDTVLKLINNEQLISCVKLFMDWLLSYPVVIATYGKSCADSIWSRLADLLNFLPNLKTLCSSGFLSDSFFSSPSLSDWTQSVPLSEDRALRGFAPLIRVHQSLDFTPSDSTPSPVQQTITRILCFIKFGHYIASCKTVPLFEYDTVSECFIGPAQREREEEQVQLLKKQQLEQEAKSNRSKLMKLMAEQRLQSEVAALSEASAKTQGVLFTPYILPDAQTLCHNLHLVKKLMNTKNFVIVIAKSVIESLDLLKKEKGNYAAREAIKFLERELEDRNRFLKTQDTSETANPQRKRGRKQDLHIWLFDGLIDCAIYYNTSSSSSATPAGGLVTLLVDKPLYDKAFGDERGGDVQGELVSLLMTGSQCGVEVSTALKFYRRWQRMGQK